MLETELINETKDQIEQLIRQRRYDDARELLVYLRQNKVEVDSDLHQFQNIVGMPALEPSLAQTNQQARLQARRQFIQDRLTGLAIAAFFLITTGNFLMPLGYLLIDWSINLGKPLTLTRIILTSLGALIVFIIIAFSLAITS